MYLNVFASVIYLATLCYCFRAGFCVRRLPSFDVRVPQGRFWIFVGALFGLLALLRLTHAEDLFRDSLREALVVKGEYKMRRHIQAPLAALAVLGMLMIGFFAWRVGRRTRLRSAMAVRVARLATIAIFGLVCLRVISLHAIDRLLFSGLHINRVLDIGAATLVAWTAWRYPRLIREEANLVQGKTKGRGDQAV